MANDSFFLDHADTAQHVHDPTMVSVSGPTETSCAATAAKHNPQHWTADEQTIMEEGLKVYSSDPPVITFAKIAANLRTKTMRDVALRFQWMGQLEEKRRKRKEEKENMKQKRRKLSPDHIGDSGSDSQSSLCMETVRFRDGGDADDDDDDDDCYSFEYIGGDVGDLLKKNREILDRIWDAFGCSENSDSLLIKCTEYLERIFDIIMKRHFQNY